MAAGKNILVGFKKRWHMMQALETFLYATGPAILMYLWKSQLFLALSVFILAVLMVLAFRKPWKLTLGNVAAYLDENLNSTEYSSGLLLLPEEELSDLANLQRYQVGQILSEKGDEVKPNVPLKWAALICGIFMVLGFLIYQFGGANILNDGQNTSNEDAVVFKALDSIKAEYVPPVLTAQKLIIQYPAYTKQRARSTSNMNVKVLEGSRLSWQLQFNKPVQNVIMESSEKDYPMKKADGDYKQTLILRASDFYNFKFSDDNGIGYLSDLYAMEVFKDEAPEVEIQELKPFTSFELEDDKILNFKVLFKDDFGVEEAYIVATVSKGEGESVKFREERLSFDNRLAVGTKSQGLSKKIDLDKMGMEPGDELYFYVGAKDTKRPKQNTTRSETYFAVIKDTLSNRFGVEGTMGADLMPDYFRSQRQLIIDTEKLLADQAKISKDSFNFTSNELGFDQKALRLKYGAFMGDEAESAIQSTEDVEVEEAEETNEEGNPLEEYTHDHDGDNEHNLVDHDHEEESEEEAEDPLESYVHNHEDPESSTLFTKSLKSKLRQAMAEMWDAELYLRLYTPEKSLPYQYRALKLIQEIKNSARIYVHRIGFDPPPIKEDKRLTGALDEISSFQKIENLAEEEAYRAMRKAVERLEQLMNQTDSIQSKDRTLFAKAGNELADLAIQEPGKYLNTLQQLKWFSDSEDQSRKQLLQIQERLLQAIPKPKRDASATKAHHSEMNELLLKELESND